MQKRLVADPMAACNVEKRGNIGGVGWITAVHKSAGVCRGLPIVVRSMSTWIEQGGAMGDMEYYNEACQSALVAVKMTTRHFVFNMWRIEVEKPLESSDCQTDKPTTRQPDKRQHIFGHLTKACPVATCLKQDGYWAQQTSKIPLLSTCYV